MTNEEFQKRVLAKLNSIEEGQNEIKEDLKAVYEQTANLTEFRTEIKQDFSDIKDTLRFVILKNSD